MVAATPKKEEPKAKVTAEFEPTRDDKKKKAGIKTSFDPKPL